MTNITPLEKRGPEETEKIGRADTLGDEFLRAEDLVPLRRQAAERSLRQALAEIEELFSENRWTDAVDLLHPVENKLPELCEQGLEVEVKSRLAFALGHLGRFDEAIAELSVCVARAPGTFRYHSALAYTAYDSLYAALNRDAFLSGKIRAERIALAHEHFEKAQALRPDGVTNFYRQGMLFKQIEKKSGRAVPLLEKAVANWGLLGREEQERRHQERKNYVKALYHAASALLEEGRPKRALPMIKRCLTEDERSNYLSLVHKYFALGKVLFHLNRFPEAKDALLFALQCRSEGPRDFVNELLARTYLSMGNPARALEILSQVPEKKRRPYFRWTEAEVYCALKDLGKAKAVLRRAQERDNRSRHKTLIRLARIEYLEGDYAAAMDRAVEAERFFHEKWGNRHHDALFWQALSTYRLGERDRALGLAVELRDLFPAYPKLDRLLKELAAGGAKEEGHGTGRS